MTLTPLPIGTGISQSTLLKLWEMKSRVTVLFTFTVKMPTVWETNGVRRASM